MVDAEPWVEARSLDGCLWSGVHAPEKLGRAGVCQNKGPADHFEANPPPLSFGMKAMPNMISSVFAVDSCTPRIHPVRKPFGLKTCL